MARAETLKELYARLYGRAGFDELRTLAGEYLEAALASMLKVAAIGLAFDPIFSEKSIDAAKITQRMASAWNLAFPNRPIESLDKRPTESVRIITHGWKSRLFASEVTRRLNEGEWIGNLRLEPGQRVEPFSPNPRNRWTLRISVSGTSSISPIQSQAIELMNLFYSVLQRYPEQSVIIFDQPESPAPHHSTASPIPFAVSTILDETARILASHRAKLATTPLFETLTDELAQCSPRLHSRHGVEEGKETTRQPAPSLPPMLMTIDVARTLRAHYPGPDLPDEAPDIVRKSRPNLLAGFPEKISSTLSGNETGTLKDWIIDAITCQPSEITKNALKKHLTSLQRIKTERLIYKAFRENEWLDRILTGYSPKNLEAMLDDNIQQTLFLLEQNANASGFLSTENRSVKPTLVWNAKR